MPTYQYYELWPTNPTPATPDVADPTAITLATRWATNTAGDVTGVKFWKAASTTGTITVAIWPVDAEGTMGSLMASKSASSGGMSTGWNTVNFDTPVAVSTSGTSYYICGYHCTGYYGASSNYFASAHNQDVLTAFADSTSTHNGVYNVGSSLAQPFSFFNKTNYWVGPILRVEIGTITLTGAQTVPITSAADATAGLPATITAAAAMALPVTSAAETRALAPFTSGYAEWVALESKPRLYYRLGEADGATCVNIGTKIGNGEFWHRNATVYLPVPAGPFHYDPTAYSPPLEQMGGDDCVLFALDQYYPDECIAGMHSGFQASQVGVTTASGCTIEGWWIRSASNDADQGYAALGCGVYDGTQNAAGARGLNIYGKSKLNTGDLNFHTYICDFYSNTIPQLEWEKVGSNGDWAYLAVVYDPEPGDFGEIRVYHRLRSESWSDTPVATYSLPSALSFREVTSPSTRAFHTDFTLGSVGGEYHSRDGLVDEVALYDRALTVDEMETHFRLGSESSYDPNAGATVTATLANSLPVTSAASVTAGPAATITATLANTVPVTGAGAATTSGAATITLTGAQAVPIASAAAATVTVPTITATLANTIDIVAVAQQAPPPGRNARPSLGLGLRMF